MFHGNFVERRVIGEGQNLHNDLSSLGKDPITVIERAQSQSTESTLVERTDEAIKLGIFGAPSFTIGGELFWGDDRLEDAVDWCLQN